jgi:hypothetical protein
MRKALLVLGICILATPAFAGGGFSLFGAYSQVNADQGSPGAGVRLSIGGDRWVGDLTWTWFESKENAKTISGYEDKVQVIPTDLGLRYLFNSRGKFDPYAGAGFTFFYNNLNDGSANNSIGGYGMLGFNIGKGRTKFFAEAIYRYGRSDVTYHLNPNEQDKGTMDVGGFGFNLGVAWAF